MAASGLTPDSSTVACPNIVRTRASDPGKWDRCQARASAKSVEFAVFATSIKLRQAAIEPSERKIAAELRGTVFELSVVATDA